MRYARGGIALVACIGAGGPKLCAPDRSGMRELPSQLARTEFGRQGIQAGWVYAHERSEGGAPVASHAERRPTSEVAAGRDAATLGDQYQQHRWRRSEQFPEK